MAPSLRKFQLHIFHHSIKVQAEIYLPRKALAIAANS